MLSALQECTDALAVYQYTLKKPSMRADIDIGCIPTEVRQCSSKETDDCRDTDHVQMRAQVHAIFEKLLHDSLCVVRLMKDTEEIVRTQRCLDELPKEVERLINQRKMEDDLINEHEGLKTSVTELREVIGKETASFSEEENYLNNELMTVKNRRAKLESTMLVESRYVNAWEKARREQNYLKCSESLERRNMNLKQCFIQEKNENRVSAKIEAFLQQNVAFNEKQTKYWLQRRHSELETYKKDIHLLRDKIGIEREEIRKLKEEYNSRQRFIDSYLADKAAVKRQKDLEEHMQRSAIKIQAWWRGVMVRRKLGRYRPEERKKKRATKARVK